MIDELTKSIRAHLYDRITNPLLGAVAITWCFWNYKLVLVLLSKGAPLDKIKIIESQLYPEWYISVLWLGIFPFLSAIAFLLAYPIPANFIYSYTRKQYKKLKAIKLAVDEETPASQEEFVQLKRKVNELENRYYTDLTEKDAEIARLNSRLSEKGLSPTSGPVEPPKKRVSGRPKEEIIKKKEHDDLLSKGHISHRVITGIQVGDNTYEIGKEIKSGEAGKVNVFRLAESFSYEDVIPVKVLLDQPLKEGQWLTVFDGYSNRELTELNFNIQKADFEDKSVRLSVVQSNPLKDKKNIVVSNIIQFAY